MEPEPKDMNKSTVDGLHDEGIEIVAGSGVREEDGVSYGSGAKDVRMEVVQEETQETEASHIPLKDFQYTPTPIQSGVPKAPLYPIPEYKPAPATQAVKAPEPMQPVQATQPIKPVIVAENKVGPMVSNDPSIKQLRTFKSDAEEAVRYNKMSVVNIAMAEQKRKESTTPIEYEADKKSHSGLILGVSLILIVALGGGWYFWFSNSGNKTIGTTTVNNVKTIVPYTKVAVMRINSKTEALSVIASKLNSADVSLGGIYAIIPAVGATSTIQMSIQDVLSSTKVPNRLNRSLGAEYMIGTYIYDTNSPFIILKNTFFQNAFAGMLDWEKSMYTDFLPFIQVSYPNQVSDGQNSVFEDTVVSNIDTRTLKDSAGKVILAYAFADQDTIVISTNMNSLKFILDKLLVVRSIQ